MGIEEENIPTIEDAMNWHVAMTHFQPDNNCDLIIRSENPSATVPANPDWKNTKLLAETKGKTPQRLIEFPDGNRMLFSYHYRNKN